MSQFRFQRHINDSQPRSFSSLLSSLPHRTDVTMDAAAWCLSLNNTQRFGELLGDSFKELLTDCDGTLEEQLGSIGENLQLRGSGKIFFYSAENFDPFHMKWNKEIRTFFFWSLWGKRKGTTSFPIWHKEVFQNQQPPTIKCKTDMKIKVVYVTCFFLLHCFLRIVV